MGENQTARDKSQTKLTSNPHPEQGAGGQRPRSGQRTSRSHGHLVREEGRMCSQALCCEEPARLQAPARRLSKLAVCCFPSEITHALCSVEYGTSLLAGGYGTLRREGWGAPEKCVRSRPPPDLRAGSLEPPPSSAPHACRPPAPSLLLEGDFALDDSRSWSGLPPTFTYTHRQLRVHTWPLTQPHTLVCTTLTPHGTHPHPHLCM